MVSEASPTARKLKADETMVLQRCKLHANSQRALEGAAHLLAMGAGARDSMRRRISFEVSLSSERTVTAKPSPHGPNAGLCASQRERAIAHLRARGSVPDGRVTSEMTVDEPLQPLRRHARYCAKHHRCPGRTGRRHLAGLHLLHDLGHGPNILTVDEGTHIAILRVDASARGCFRAAQGLRRGTMLLGELLVMCSITPVLCRWVHRRRPANRACTFRAPATRGPAALHRARRLGLKLIGVRFGRLLLLGSCRLVFTRRYLEEAFTQHPAIVARTNCACRALAKTLRALPEQ